MLDTSALLAIAMNEEASIELDYRIAGEEDVFLSAGTLTELLIVSGQRGVQLEVEDVLVRLRVQILEVTEVRARAAGAAYRQWGRGNHPAALNFGDCFAYTLARELGCPLLFVGNDFSRTDITSAI